jgi:phosphatidate cytidylyltransferase
MKRTITGFVFVVVLIAGTIIHPFIFGMLYAAVTFFTVREFYNLIRQSEYTPNKLLGSILAVLVFLTGFAISFFNLPQQFYLIIFLFFIVIFVIEIYSYKHFPLQNSAVTLLGLIYVAIPFSLVNFIVFSGDSDQRFYPWILIGIFFIVWVFDSAAYVFGSWLGKHRLFERVSPKKSWEGFIGGAVFAIVMGILNAVMFQSLSMTNWIIVSVIVIVFGTFGDLFESKIKRELDIKDSGGVLPGHGGLLDRFDSLLFALPVIYIWLIIAGNLI